MQGINTKIIVLGLFSAMVLGAQSIGVSRGNAEPGECKQNLYTWNGRGFECVPTDRVEWLMLQRNRNMKAFNMCKAELEFTKSTWVVELAKERNRNKCRESGKKFDTVEATCKGSLSEGE